MILFTLLGFVQLLQCVRGEFILDFFVIFILDPRHDNINIKFLTLILTFLFFFEETILKQQS